MKSDGKEEDVSSVILRMQQNNSHSFYLVWKFTG
jgi:hypothetical protein